MPLDPSHENQCALQGRPSGQHRHVYDVQTQAIGLAASGLGYVRSAHWAETGQAAEGATDMPSSGARAI